MNKAQAIAAVVKAAESRLNYNPGRTYSDFGKWYGWPNALWCACGASWSFYQGLGSSEARKIIGVQADSPNGRGWVWTVAWRAWLLANGGVKVGPNKAEPGDIMFFKYPTSDGRNSNVVNHVDLVVGHFNTKGQYVPTIGFNTPKPGSGGDPSNGRGVWRHKRDRHDRYIECVIRPPWHKLGGASKATPSTPAGVPAELADLGYAKTVAGVKEFQKDRGIKVDGVVGPTTRNEIEEAMSEVIDLLKQIARQTDPTKPYTQEDGLTKDQAEKYRYTSRAKLQAYGAESSFTVKQQVAQVAAAVGSTPGQVADIIRPTLVAAATEVLGAMSRDIDAEAVAEAVIEKLAVALTD